MFSIGSIYSRKEISEIVGGSVKYYLPMKRDKVVAVCFSKESNPEGPKAILIGRGPLLEKAANILSKQLTPIPVFMQIGVNKWEYQGKYKPVSYLTDDIEIQKYVKQSRLSNIVGVILLELV